ncbi:MAG: metal-sensitive transcriptional regulator [bacterium]|nr:metal-sensitive transcriptional regulator [bacterium]
MINEPVKKASLSRLKKIRGQVEGLMRMVDNEKYCIDVINQVNAIRRALEQVALILMKRHVESCVAHSIKKEGGKEKIDELIHSIDRFIR